MTRRHRRGCQPRRRGRRHNPGLGLIEPVVAPLPGAGALSRDPHRLKDPPQVLPRDRPDDTVSDQVAAQRGERPASTGFSELAGTGKGDGTDPPPGGVIDPPRTPAPGKRADRRDPIGIELADHPPHLVLIGPQHPSDLRRGGPRVRRQQDLRPLPQSEDLRRPRDPAQLHPLLRTQRPHGHRRWTSHNQPPCRYDNKSRHRDPPARSTRGPITSAYFSDAPLETLHADCPCGQPPPGGPAAQNDAVRHRQFGAAHHCSGDPAGRRRQNGTSVAPRAWPG